MKGYDSVTTSQLNSCLARRNQTLHYVLTSHCVPIGTSSLSVWLLQEAGTSSPSQSAPANKPQLFSLFIRGKAQAIDLKKVSDIE